MLRILIVLNERHLKRLMNEYVRYYHEDRTHLALGKGTPDGREAVNRSEAGNRIAAMPRLGGLHHRYDLGILARPSFWKRVSIWLSHGRPLLNFNQCSCVGEVGWERSSRRSPSRNLLGADRVSQIRNRSNVSVLPAEPVQKVVVETSTFERSNSDPALGELVTRLAAGDESAFAQLYDCTNRIVYGLALRILGDSSSAEDVAMEVYLQVWRTASRYDHQRGTVTSWLVMLVRSRALDCLRSRRARRADLEENVDDVPNLRDSRPTPELASLEVGRSRIVQKAMADLTPDQREAIELAYFLGLSHSEMAERTGLPLGTVKTRIRLGMLHLRKLLGSYAEGL